MKQILIPITCVLITINTFAQNDLVVPNNNFAFKIYNASRPDSDNFFISPFSLNIALSIANEGAVSTTRQEMDSLLCIHGIGNRESAYRDLIYKSTNPDDPAYKMCVEFSDDRSNSNHLYLANSIWINDKYKIYDDYLKDIKENFKSEVFGFNLSNISAANNELNQWISEKTNDKIRNISGFREDIVMSIVNAIYFMGEWERPFNKKSTDKQKFHTLEKEKVEIDFMHDRAQYVYYEDEDIKGIYLPYRCNQFSMMVILPNDKYGILDVEKKLNYDYLKKIKQSAYRHEVILSLPKFKIETEMYPKSVIKQMGYREMFSDNADFVNICKTDTLKIDKIIHKTFIEVDERKTEAAAVTKIDMQLTGQAFGGERTPPEPKVFNADHPFVFLIIDNRTGAILFTGRFVKE